MVDGSDSPPTGSIKLACAGIGCSFPTAPVDPNKPLSSTVRVEGPPHSPGLQPRASLALVSLTPPLARSVHQAYLDGTLGGPSPDVAYEWSWDVEGLALAEVTSGTVTEQRLEIMPAGLSNAAPGFQLAVTMTNTTTGGSSQATLKIRVGQPPYCSLEEPSNCIQVRSYISSWLHPAYSSCALMGRLSRRDQMPCDGGAGHGEWGLRKSWMPNRNVSCRDESPILMTPFASVACRGRVCR